MILRSKRNIAEEPASFLADRLRNGLSRITRLSSLGYSLSAKERLLMTSVFPAALCGFEFEPPSQGSFHKLRAAAARALYGGTVALSSAIALPFWLQWDS